MYLHAQGVNPFEPPDEYKSRAQFKIKKRLKLNKDSKEDEEKKDFKVTFQQQRRESNQNPSFRKFRKAATFVKKAMSFDAFKVPHKQDWIESLQAGVKLYTHCNTREVTAVCPWDPPKPTADVEEIELDIHGRNFLGTGALINDDMPDIDELFAKLDSMRPASRVRCCLKEKESCK